MRKCAALRPRSGGAADGTVVTRTIAASEMYLEPLEMDGPRRRRPSGARILAIRGGGDVSARPWRRVLDRPASYGDAKKILAFKFNAKKRFSKRSIGNSVFRRPTMV